MSNTSSMQSEKNVTSIAFNLPQSVFKVGDEINLESAVRVNSASSWTASVDGDAFTVSGHTLKCVAPSLGKAVTLTVTCDGHSESVHISSVALSVSQKRFNPFTSIKNNNGLWKYALERIILIFFTAVIILCITYILVQCIPWSRPEGSTFDSQLQYWRDQVALGFWEEVTDKGRIANNQYDVPLVNGVTGAKYYFAQLPLMVRFWHWFGNVLTKWDWGTSIAISMNKSAMEIEMARLPVSMKLNLISICISIPLGIGLGILAALRKNSWVDNLISTGIMVFISVPSFVAISFLLIWLAYGTRWLPSQWPSQQQAEADAALAIKAYIIPVAALSFGSIASFARWTRAELTEVMSSEFLLLARTKGLTKGQTVVRHALRNSMVPIIPMIIGEFVGILSGSMVLEQLYGINGIGSLFVTALTAKDYSVVMVDMAIYTLIGLFATLMVDLSYGIVDPRIRMGARK